MKSRLAIAATFAGVAVLVAVALVAFQFGRIDPSPPSLRNTPAPSIPGEILYTSGQSCLTRADASGANRHEICYPALLYIGPFTWVDANTIRTWSQGVVADIDLRTGARTPVSKSGSGIEKFPLRPPVSSAGDTVLVDRGDLYLVSAGGQQKIASFDIGDTWLEPIVWSPDGKWILVRWQPPRGRESELWIVSRDGSVKGTLATNFEGNWAAWRIDGVGTTPTVDEMFGAAAR